MKTAASKCGCPGTADVTKSKQLQGRHPSWPQKFSKDDSDPNRPLPRRLTLNSHHLLSFTFTTRDEFCLYAFLFDRTVTTAIHAEELGHHGAIGSSLPANLPPCRRATGQRDAGLNSPNHKPLDHLASRAIFRIFLRLFTMP